MGETIDGAVVDTSQQATGQSAKHETQSAVGASGAADGDAQDAGRDGRVASEGGADGDGEIGSRESGVLARVQENRKGRDGKGRFLPGNTFASLGGYSKQYAISVADALAARFPPERIADLIDESIEIARSQGSSRGVLGAAAFAMDYTSGKPTQRSEHITANADKIMARFERLAGINTGE